MKKEEKVMKMLKYLKDKGLKRTTCFALAIIILTNNWSAFKAGETTVTNKNNSSFDFDISMSLSLMDNFSDTVVKEDAPKELTNEEKIDVILEREDITREEFDIIAATVMGEAAPGSYDDAYAVINTFYNRTISKSWINEMIRATGVDNGDNLFAQITLVNQSEVYTSGRYEEFLGVSEGPVYQAVIDFLYTLDSMHDYLCFFASYGEIPDSVQFVEGGNWYYSLMLSDDRVEQINTKLVRTK